MSKFLRHASIGMVLVLVFSFQNCSQTQFEANTTDMSSRVNTPTETEEEVVPTPSPPTKPKIADIESASMTEVIAVLYDDGTVWTWGNNYWGTLGYYSDEPQKKPKKMTEIANVKKIVGSSYSFFVNKDDDTVWAWGYNDGNLLGLSSSFANQGWVVKPLQVDISAPLTRASTHYLLGANNKLYMTGVMSLLYLGLGSGQRYVASPEMILASESFSWVSSISNGGGYALKLDGQVMTWGDSSMFALGRPSEGVVLTPGVVPGLPKIIQLSSVGWPYQGSVLAVDQNGSLWGWSDGEWGAYPLGGRNSKVPLKLDFIDNVASVTHSMSSVLALKKDGTVWAWGVNSEGKLCLPNSGATYMTPQKLALEGVIKIVMTSHTSAFLTKDGKVYSCGYNVTGTLGIDSDQIRSLVPVEVKFE